MSAHRSGQLGVSCMPSHGREPIQAVNIVSSRAVTHELTVTGSTVLKSIAEDELDARSELQDSLHVS